MNRVTGFLFFTGSMLLLSCAIQVAPTGGDKDVIPPQVVKSSPENYSTGFQSADIQITFDEYITLQELSTHLIVSPPLRQAPEAKVKKKTLSIHIEDTLLENTTYTMNFGNAIKDIHEGNAVENFQYVFSTGTVIDSLKVSGKVEDAFQLKTEKGIYVMLYRNHEDSMPLKALPDYFTRTGEGGEFEVKNVSPGPYSIFALKDNNNNYLFDNKDEPISFGSERTEAGQTGIRLRLFKELPKQQLLKTTSEGPGKAMAVYSRPLDQPEITFFSDTSLLQIYSVHFSENKDTITFWYRNQLADSLKFNLRTPSLNDTVTIRLKRIDTKSKSKYTPVLTTQYPSKTVHEVLFGVPVVLEFNHPIEVFLLDSIRLFEDTVEIRNPNIVFTDVLKRKLKVDLSPKENTKYRIEFPQGTFTDIFGNKNDTTVLSFATKAITDYGTIAVSIQLPDGTKQHIMQLIDDKETIYRQSLLRGDTTLNFENLDPRLYRFKLTEDADRNGKWDTGNYLLRLQPERIIYYKEGITVRANWDVDLKWKVDWTIK